jgi:hypothetical protein
MVQATWKKVAAAASIQRSSHTLSVIGNTSYIFGGELRPREPVDGQVYTVGLASSKAPRVNIFLLDFLRLSTHSTCSPAYAHTHRYSSNSCEQKAVRYHPWPSLMAPPIPNHSQESVQHPRH